MRRTLSILLASVLALCTMAGRVSAAALPSSTFDADAEGWSAVVSSNTTLTWHGTGGNPGGYLDVAGPDAFAEAPSKFHGDWSAALGGAFRFDALPESPGQTDFYVGISSPHVRLESVGFDLLAGWQTVTLPLIASTTGATWKCGTGDCTNGSGSAATEADIENVLANVQEVRIGFFEDHPSNGTSSSASIDNVRFVPSTYDFTGFFAPVDNAPTLNVAKAASAIPVKFSLGGDEGLDILAVGSPASATMSCGGGTADDIEQTVTAGSSGLSYDAATQQYTYIWKTNKSWGGTCRQFVLTLDDGTTHVANFQFK